MTNDVPGRRMFLAGLLLIGAGALAGCNGPPQIDRQNRRLIQSLRTAVSARKVDWLDQNSVLVEKRRTEGLLAGDQYDALKSIIDLARAGDWAAAEAEVIRLAKSQQPLAE